MDVSANPVATTQTEFFLLALLFPEGDEFSLMSSGLTLACIASSAFVFPSISAPALGEACIDVLILSVAAILS